MQPTAIERYEIFKKYFSEEDAKIVTESTDESPFRWVAGKEDIAEVKDDIAAVKVAVFAVKAELRGDMLKMEGSLREGMAWMQHMLT
jgi:hypothetical protein